MHAGFTADQPWRSEDETTPGSPILFAAEVALRRLVSRRATWAIRWLVPRRPKAPGDDPWAIRHASNHLPHFDPRQLDRSRNPAREERSHRMRSRHVSAQEDEQQPFLPSPSESPLAEVRQLLGITERNNNRSHHKRIRIAAAPTIPESKRTDFLREPLEK